MASKEKEQQYLDISKQIVEIVGGIDNIVASAHCATRLRIVLKNYDDLDLDRLDDVPLAKGQFIAGNQLQIIFGAGLVNDVHEAFARYTNTENSSLGDIKDESAKKLNPFQAVIKSLSDVFIDIMPGILAAALLLGITGVLGKWDVVTNNKTLYAINRLAAIASAGIFEILPMAVCYSACKRYGGKPILGMVVGSIMLSGSLANAYQAAQGAVKPEIISLFGMPIELVGFQGGIIIALMMGFVVAKLDKFFDKKIPDVVKLLFSPLCTVFISTLLLFTIIGPVGRGLSNGITNGLVWMTENLGIIGYMVFAGVQQIVVITGLHHILGAIESTLIANTGRNFLNPLMSVALIAQGGAVLGYLALHWKNTRVRELCIPSFASTLFGISEPAIFGVNLRYKFPLVGGCIGGALAGGYVYLTNLASLGFGTSGIPGLAITDPTGNGYVNFIIAHLIGIAGGFIFTVIFGKVVGIKVIQPKESKKIDTEEGTVVSGPVGIKPCAEGTVKDITACKDLSFASKAMGEGIIIENHNGKIVSPCDGKVGFVFPSKHAIGIKLANGASVLIHCGIDTVSLNGKGFDVLVKEGQKVKAGDPLIDMDVKYVERNGLCSEIIMAYELMDNKLVLKPLDNATLDTTVAVIG